MSAYLNSWSARRTWIFFQKIFPHKALYIKKFGQSFKPLAFSNNCTLPDFLAFVLINTMNHKAYTILMALELTSIGIKYEGSSSNPFQHLSPITLLFITTMFCHVVVAFTAEMTLPTTILVFHVSGIVGYQTLLWIVVAEFSWWYIINVIVLLVASFCFKWHMSNATF